MNLLLFKHVIVEFIKQLGRLSTVALVLCQLKEINKKACSAHAVQEENFNIRFLTLNQVVTRPRFTVVC